MVILDKSCFRLFLKTVFVMTSDIGDSKTLFMHFKATTTMFLRAARQIKWEPLVIMLINPELNIVK